MICLELQNLLPSSSLPQEVTSAQELFISSSMTWVSIAVEQHTSLRTPWAMPSISWIDVKHFSTGLSGNMLPGVMNHATIWQSGGPQG